MTNLINFLLYALARKALPFVGSAWLMVNLLMLFNAMFAVWGMVEDWGVWKLSWRARVKGWGLALGENNLPKKKCQLHHHTSSYLSPATCIAKKCSTQERSQPMGNLHRKFNQIFQTSPTLILMGRVCRTIPCIPICNNMDINSSTQTWCHHIGTHNSTTTRLWWCNIRTTANFTPPRLHQTMARAVINPPKSRTGSNMTCTTDYRCTLNESLPRPSATMMRTKRKEELGSIGTASSQAELRARQPITSKKPPWRTSRLESTGQTQSTASHSGDEAWSCLQFNFIIRYEYFSLDCSI